MTTLISFFINGGRTNTTSVGDSVTLLGAINNIPIQEDHRLAINLFLSNRGVDRVREKETSLYSTEWR